jgi:hypothetical protein
MTGLSHISYEIILVQSDRFGQPVETYGQCDWHGSIKYLIPLAVLNISILVLALIEAWRARNLATEFAESQYIARALFLMLLVIFIGLPVLVIAKDNPNATLFISSGIIFVVVSCILCVCVCVCVRF